MPEGRDLTPPPKTESLNLKSNIFSKSNKTSTRSKSDLPDQQQTNAEIGQIKKEITKLDSKEQKSESEIIEQQKIDQYVKIYGSFEDNSLYIKTPPPESSSNYQDKLKSDFSLHFERLKETIFLKKNGVSNPQSTADFFLSRGLKTDFLFFLKDSDFNIDNYVAGINRLQTIGFSGEYFMTKDFIAQDKDNNLVESFKKLSELSDLDFQNNLSSSNQYFFLNKSEFYKSAQTFDRDIRSSFTKTNNYRFFIPKCFKQRWNN